MRPWSIKGQRPLSGWRAVLSLRVPWWRIDWPILLLGAGFVALGLIFVEHMAQADELLARERPILSGSQLKKSIVVAPALVFGLLLRPRWVRRNAYLLYALALVLVGLLPVFGEERNGARSWYDLGFDLQPSELLKLGVILALARALYTNRMAEPGEWRVPALLVLVPMAMVAAQPDLGTAMTLVPIALGMFWLAGARTGWLVALVLSVAAAGFTAWKLEWIQGYQAKRIDTWIEGFDNQDLIRSRTGAGFHAYQARVAIGNGGLSGTGLGQGVANEAGHLPERESDSIFAVIAEETGFLGAAGLVGAYLLFAGLLLLAAARTRERFSRLVIAGTALYFVSHFALNTGVNLGLVPMTGLTLPLISTGGSSLLASLALLGLALGLSARAEVVLDEDSFRE